MLQIQIAVVSVVINWSHLLNRDWSLVNSILFARHWLCLRNNLIVGIAAIVKCEIVVSIARLLLLVYRLRIIVVIVLFQMSIVD